VARKGCGDLPVDVIRKEDDDNILEQSILGDAYDVATRFENVVLA
jgi:hypothetical protein